MKNKRNIILIGLLFFVVAVSIGYAYLSATLNITGTANVEKQTWDVHFENVANATASSSDVTVTKAAYIEEADSEHTPSDQTDDLNVKFTVTFKKPGDSYTFNVDVVNNGTLPAKVHEIIKTIPAGDATTYLDYTITNLAEDEIIQPGNSKTLTVTAAMKDLDTLPANSFTATLGFSAEFRQVNPSA